MNRRHLLVAGPALLVPQAFAQTDSGGGAASHDSIMHTIGDIICDGNRYTNQDNKVTGIRTGPMQFPNGRPPAEVLVDGYTGTPWQFGSQRIFANRVLSFEYAFATYRGTAPTGLHRERIVVLYAGGDGPG